MYGLTYWPDNQVAPKLWDWIRAEGPTHATIGYFLHLTEFAAAHTSQLVEASIPYLQSDSPVVAGRRTIRHVDTRVASGFAR
jgi:hypothetical protein